MIHELEKLDTLGDRLTERAQAAGALLIWRAQARSVRHVLVRGGRSESTTASSVSGHGLQLVTPEGRTVLGSRDDFRPEPAQALLERLIEVAGRGDALELASSPPVELSPHRARQVPPAVDAFDRIDLGAITRRLIELEAELVSRSPGVVSQISWRAELDAWRVRRSDGCDVLFAMPRCTLGARATTEGEGARHGISAMASAPRPDLLWDDAIVAPFLKRAREAAGLARKLPDAPTHPAGSFPAVIDYALAKGLAHEAFGHASEADGYRSSILAREGRFRAGETVGADHVSIVDEPVEGDHAWQPYSANGIPRKRVVLVERGRLKEGLSDPWSAGPGGVPLTGAARAESYRNAPQPRMSNIRIETDSPLAAPGPFEDYGPEAVRDLLAAAGIFERHPRVAYLSGYTGGQVNAATGDFVFQCQAIYALTPSGIALHKPAIFSGSMFGALQSVREAFGPLRLDAIGYCGKWGQSVPSSGGSHYFLFLEPHPTVRLGGR
jgi:TldD protein